MFQKRFRVLLDKLGWVEVPEGCYHASKKAGMYCAELLEKRQLFSANPTGIAPAPAWVLVGDQWAYFKGEMPEVCTTTVTAGAEG